MYDESWSLIPVLGWEERFCGEGSGVTGSTGSSLRAVSTVRINWTSVTRLLSHFVSDEQVLTIERSATSWYIAWKSAWFVVLLMAPGEEL